jgi:hypothetical protein
MSLQNWFTSLDEVLLRHQALWQSNPFHAPETFSRLLDGSQLNRLQGLTVDALEVLQANDSKLAAALQDVFPMVGEIQLAMRPLPAARTGTGLSPAVAMLTEKMLASVPGRKQAQIRYFADALGSVEHPVLDWCAGKAHLGRSLHAMHQLPVRALEIQPVLVSQGQELARGAAITLHCADVMAELPLEWLTDDQQAVALHACGDLHRRFLEVCVGHDLPRISLAPCCYQKTRSEFYRPLSRQAATSSLVLSRDDLRTAVRAPVTLSQAENRRRRQLQSWRLGFDLLQRELSGNDNYLPLPTFPVAVLKFSFAHFCQLAATRKHLALPDSIDYAHFEALGQHRLETVTRLDLVRSLFRRCMELWLVLDMALFLEENGYACRISQFCPVDITPRNLLLDARRCRTTPLDCCTDTDLSGRGRG